MQPCPRQQEEATLQSQLQHKSHWQEDGTCSYCGSLSPELFFKAIESNYELGPTDKNYKVYVDQPEPDAGIPSIHGSANFKQDRHGWIQITKENIDELKDIDGFDERFHKFGDYVNIGPKSSIRHDKFYFQHLTVEDRMKFIELYNQRKINIGMPGHFYVLPFFMKLR